MAEKKEDNHVVVKEKWYVKAQAEIIGGLVVLTFAAAVSFLWSLNSNVNAVMEQMSGLQDVGVIKERLNKIELKGAGSGAYAQLSSATNQFYNDGKPHLEEFEIRDGAKDIDFDPRVSVTDITAVKTGSYLLIAAPQVGFATDSISCVNMWMKINGNDVNNSNIRLCNDKSIYTDVMVLQAIFPLHEGDILSLSMSVTGGTAGIEAIRVPLEPLVPAIIFSLLYLGE
jgi:hypothetical protein